MGTVALVPLGEVVAGHDDLVEFHAVALDVLEALLDLVVHDVEQDVLRVRVLEALGNQQRVEQHLPSVGEGLTLACLYLQSCALHLLVRVKDLDGTVDVALDAVGPGVELLLGSHELEQLQPVLVVPAVEDQVEPGHDVLHALLHVGLHLRFSLLQVEEGQDLVVDGFVDDALQGRLLEVHGLQDRLKHRVHRVTQH